MVLSEVFCGQAQRVAAMRKAGVHVVPCAPPKHLPSGRDLPPCETEPVCASHSHDQLGQLPSYRVQLLTRGLGCADTNGRLFDPSIAAWREDNAVTHMCNGTDGPYREKYHSTGTSYLDTQSSAHEPHDSEA